MLTWALHHELLTCFRLRCPFAEWALTCRCQPVPQNSNVLRRVLSEFAGLYQTLTEAAGVNVNLFQHSVGHDTPDACFPNNWFSTHAIGEARGGVTENTLVLYPMKTSNRRGLESE